MPCNGSWSRVNNSSPMMDTHTGKNPQVQPSDAASVQDPATAEQATLRILADNVPSQYSYIDAGEVYRYVNRLYEQRFGRPADQIVGRTVREILGPEGYAIARPYIDGVLGGEPQHYEHEFTFLDGTHVMDVLYGPDRAEDGSIRGFFVLVHDVTRSKALEQQLRESKDRLAAIIGAAADGIITMDTQGVIRDFNPAAERMFGRPADTVIGQDARLILPPQCRDCAEYPACFRAGRCVRDTPHPQEFTGYRSDGTRFPMEITVSQIDHLNLLAVLVRDISERRRLERDIIDAATREQARIGREIHDGVGQQLTALSLLAGSIGRKLHGSGHSAAGAEVGRLVQHLQQALDQAHNLARGLAPVEIDPEGLADALAQLARDVQEMSGIACVYRGIDRPKVENSEIALHLYRIAQEAVNNALKHASPQHIDIRLASADGMLELSVRDDGIGIPDQAEREGRLGLHLMRYRANIIGGHLQIGPATNGGTEIRCSIALWD
jgi:PAS domain S-box-containing protein